jgi:valyl-tRNA synthetase
VDPAFGTGLMMVCTFGDIEDVEKWRRDGLDLRLVVARDGKTNELAGEFAGLELPAARKRIVEKLSEVGDLRGEKPIDQSVSVHERCSTPIEFAVVPQWFINVLGHVDEFLERGEQLAWFPDWMQVRYKDWVNGLKWDWNISRQRFYGVPFPVWYCADCAKPVLARVEELPVDPTESTPPVSACPACGGGLVPEQDVMDTWMTSSGTPLINGGWAAGDDARMSQLYPMSVRVQAFEIIRTWLFYTVVKSHFHTDSLPWRDVMISGWGLNEQGKKISKRDLQKSTDASGYNRYDPYQVMKKYGADALRYWATGAGLGYDLRYNERDVKAGKRLLIKLWNASRFGLMQLEGYDFSVDLPLAERTVVDRWIWHHANVTLEKVTAAFEQYDFATARDAVDRFFWHHLCDNYLEMIKDRFWTRDAYTDHERLSAQVTLSRVLRLVLAMYAPFVPHVTEALYQRIFRDHEGTVSLHVTRWPGVDEAALTPVEAGDRLTSVLSAVRHLRTQLRLPNSRRLSSLTVEAPAGWREQIEPITTELQAAVRADALSFGDGESETNVEGVRLTVVPAPATEETDAPAG